MSAGHTYECTYVQIDSFYLAFLLVIHSTILNSRFRDLDIRQSYLSQLYVAFHFI